MTTATFYFGEMGVYGFSVEGHSGLAPQGEDILCAAISSAVQLVEGVISDVLDLEAATVVEEAFVSVTLPEKIEEEAYVTCQNLLMGLTLHFANLAAEYPGHLQVKEAQ